MLYKNLPNTKQKIVAVIQARMGSRRLPGKALKKILGRTLIDWIFYRLSFCKEIGQIVLSTANTPENDRLAAHAKKIGLFCFRGSEKDLVSRLFNTARKFGAKAIVRITGDCPLVDPSLVDKLVKTYQRGRKLDYVCNVLPPTYPDGMDIEIISLAALTRLDREVKDSIGREWITTTIMQNPKKFKILSVPYKKNLSYLRLTVDYPEDFRLTEIIFKKLHKEGKIFTMEDILKLFSKDPSLPTINEKWVDKTIINNIRSGEFHRLKK
jgi:spore coat polysaccharide biosynthesis protein SpsF